MSVIEPSAEGHRRYPGTGGYYDGVNPPVPCNCLDSCPSRCTGRSCGCEACAIAFADLLDVAGEINAKGQYGEPDLDSDHHAIADRYEGTVASKDDA